MSFVWGEMAIDLFSENNPSQINPIRKNPLYLRSIIMPLQ